MNSNICLVGFSQGGNFGKQVSQVSNVVDSFDVLEEFYDMYSSNATMANRVIMHGKLLGDSVLESCSALRTFYQDNLKDKGISVVVLSNSESMSKTINGVFVDIDSVLCRYFTQLTPLHINEIVNENIQVLCVRYKEESMELISAQEDTDSEISLGELLDLDSVKPNNPKQVVEADKQDVVNSQNDAWRDIPDEFNFDNFNDLDDLEGDTEDLDEDSDYGNNSVGVTGDLDQGSGDESTSEIVSRDLEDVALNGADTATVGESEVNEVDENNSKDTAEEAPFEIDSEILNLFSDKEVDDEQEENFSDMEDTSEGTTDNRGGIFDFLGDNLENASKETDSVLSDILEEPKSIKNDTQSIKVPDIEQTPAETITPTKQPIPRNRKYKVRHPRKNSDSSDVGRGSLGVLENGLKNEKKAPSIGFKTVKKERDKGFESDKTVKGNTRIPLNNENNTERDLESDIANAMTQGSGVGNKRDKYGRKVILTTGHSGAGVSYVSALVAMGYNLLNAESTLLVDLDFLYSTMAYDFGISTQEVLQGNVVERIAENRSLSIIEEFIIELPNGLNVLTFNPTTMPNNHCISELILKALKRSKYNVIIFDTPVYVLDKLPESFLFTVNPLYVLRDTGAGTLKGLYDIENMDFNGASAFISNVGFVKNGSDKEFDTKGFIESLESNVDYDSIPVLGGIPHLQWDYTASSFVKMRKGKQTIGLENLINNI